MTPHETIIRAALKAAPGNGEALASLDAVCSERAALGLFLWQVAEILGVKPEGAWPAPSEAGIVEEHVVSAITELKTNQKEQA